MLIDMPTIARSLDESLQTSHGPVRTFLILTHYATRTVFDETMDQIRAHSGIRAPAPGPAGGGGGGGGLGLLFSAADQRHLWTRSWLGDMMLWARAWLGYARVEMRLNVYERYLAVRGRFGWTVGL